MLSRTGHGIRKNLKMAVGIIGTASSSSSSSSSSFLAFLLMVLASYQLAECQTNKFVIKDAGKVSKASRLIISHAPNYVTFLPNAGAVPIDEISNIAALTLGFSSLKEITWSGLLAGNIFRRPKANVLITVEGVTTEDKFDVSGKLAAYPVHETEAGSSLSEILALSDVPGETLPKHVSDSFQGKPLTVSLSAGEQEAIAGFSPGTNSHTLYWNGKKEKFLSLQAPQGGAFDDVTVTKEEVLKRLEKADFGKVVKYSKDAHIFTVAIPGKGNAVFDMNKKEDFLLFAEVDAIFELLKQLTKDPELVNDGIPDIFAITISSLKILRNRYGEHSLEAQGGVILLKALLPKMTSQFAELYHGNSVVEVLALEWQGNLHDKYPDALEHVYQYVQPHLHSQSVEMFRNNLPGVNLRDDLDDNVKESLCSSLQSKLLNIQPNLKIACLGSHHRARRAVELSGQAPLNNTMNLGVVYDRNYPVIFNIWLWLVIALALSLYAVSIVLWDMDPGRDSIIYRMTSQRMKTE